MKRRAFIKFFSALLIFPTTLLEACKAFRSKTDSPMASLPQTPPQIHDLIFNLRITDRQPSKVSSNIRALLQEAIDSGKPIRALGGGHGYLGQALCKDGLVIDMRAHRYVAVNREEGTLKAEAGARFIEVYKALADANGELDLVLPTGDCPTVGLAGFTLGGGYGHLSRCFGIMCDNLIALKVLVVDGSNQIVEKYLTPQSQGDDAELFWALRGSGGAHFGIVTEFTFQARSKPKDIRLYELCLRGNLDPEAMATALKIYFDWLEPLLDDFSLSSKLSVGQGWFHIEGFYSELQIHKVQGLFDQLHPYLISDKSNAQLPFNLSQITKSFKQCATLEECEKEPKYAFAARSAFLDLKQLRSKIPELCAAIEEREKHYTTYGGIEVMAWRMQGGLFPDNAFQHRHHDVLCQFFAKGMEDEKAPWLQGLFAALTGQPDNDSKVPAYQDYIDGSIADAEQGFPEAYFPGPERNEGPSVVAERLRAIQQKYKRLG